MDIRREGEMDIKREGEMERKREGEGQWVIGAVGERVRGERRSIGEEEHRRGGA